MRGVQTFFLLVARNASEWICADGIHSLAFRACIINTVARRANSSVWCGENGEAPRAIFAVERGGARRPPEQRKKSAGLRQRPKTGRRPQQPMPATLVQSPAEPIPFADAAIVGRYQSIVVPQQRASVDRPSRLSGLLYRVLGRAGTPRMQVAKRCPNWTGPEVACLAMPEEPHRREP